MTENPNPTTTATDAIELPKMVTFVASEAGLKRLRRYLAENNLRLVARVEYQGDHLPRQFSLPSLTDPDQQRALFNTRAKFHLLDADGQRTHVAALGSITKPLEDMRRYPAADARTAEKDYQRRIDRYNDLFASTEVIWLDREPKPGHAGPAIAFRECVR